MRVMQKVTFYTKLNCGLCDEAYLMLMQVAVDVLLEIDIIDITHSHNRLGHKYDERIPVIALSGADKELDWPFTKDDIEAYLK